MVLHLLQQDLDRLLAVVALVLGSVQVVSLVDEQHSAHRALEHFARLRRRVTDVLPDEVVARHRDEVTFAHVAEPVQDFRHAHGDGGLAGARIAGEAHVQRRRAVRAIGRETCLPAQRLDEQERADVADAALHRHEPDELVVELLQHLADVRGAEGRVEIERPRPVPRMIGPQLLACSVHLNPRSHIPWGAQ
jgi:hypothetical protein